jgi:23S rRNA pseudouridine1911/1915/1917 synthase
LPKLESSPPIQIKIPEDSHGLRLDKYLSGVEAIGTRSRAAKLIADGMVLKNNKPLRASYLVQANDVLEVEIPQVATEEIQPLDLKLDIFFEDGDCLVVNKPAGLVVHPAAGHAQDTLVNALVGQISNLSMGFSEKRPGIVHRLDKDTSGLLAVAKNDKAHELLAGQFKRREVHRVYWALVFGELMEKQKTIESRLSRHPTQRKRFASRSEGKRAVTHNELIGHRSGI